MSKNFFQLSKFGKQQIYLSSAFAGQVYEFYPETDLVYLHTEGYATGGDELEYKIKLKDVEFGRVITIEHVNGSVDPSDVGDDPDGTDETATVKFVNPIIDDDLYFDEDSLENVFGEGSDISSFDSLVKVQEADEFILTGPDDDSNTAYEGDFSEDEISVVSLGGGVFMENTNNVKFSKTSNTFSFS